jgi:hypothetical protein
MANIVIPHHAGPDPASSLFDALLILDPGVRWNDDLTRLEDFQNSLAALEFIQQGA